MAKDIFDIERLPPALDAYLRDTNPWWEARPGPVLPEYRRWAFHTTLRKLNSGLAPITVIRGPRQVGKTTLQLQLIAHLIEKEQVDPSRILRVQFDDISSLRGLSEPVLSITRWYENRILRRTFNEAAKEGRWSYLLLDKVQNLPDWAPQLKALVDHHSLKVLVTGSSALRIEQGRDSLAGRIAQVELGTFLLREIAGLRFGANWPPHMPDNGLESLLEPEFWRELQLQGMQRLEIRDHAFKAFSERGGYPIAQARADVPWPEVADQLNETVIQRAIHHDLRTGQRGAKRDPNLLEEVYRLACRYAGQQPGQAVFIQQIRHALSGNIGWKRIFAYLKFLEGAMLLRLVQPLEIRLKRRKGNHKLCICDHGLRASWLQEQIPLDREGLRRSAHLHDLAGHLVESVVGFYLGGIPHLDLAHFPERGAEPEVDFVMTVGERRIPIEIKYRERIDPHRDTLGLRAFLEKTANNSNFGLIVTFEDNVMMPDPRIVPISLPSFLMLR